MKLYDRVARLYARQSIPDEHKIWVMYNMFHANHLETILGKNEGHKLIKEKFDLILSAVLNDNREDVKQHIKLRSYYNLYFSVKNEMMKSESIPSFIASFMALVGSTKTNITHTGNNTNHMCK